MSGGNALPVTGGIALGSVVIGQTQLVAIALGIILVGVILVRLGFRRKRGAFER